jgi:hypothetical protein
MTGTTNNSFAGIRYYYQANGGTGNWDVGYSWNEITGASIFWDSQIAPPPNQWSFVGVVVTPTNATLYVFNTNGLSTAMIDGTVPGIFGPFTNMVMAFDTPEYIGTDPGGATVGSGNFDGVIDEVAIFNRAMGSNDLQVLYDAALDLAQPVNLQISHVGSSVQLSWGSTGQLLEASTVNGPWTTNSLAASPYLVSPTNAQRFYRILVH